jgi:hypothetical protein
MTIFCTCTEDGYLGNVWQNSQRCKNFLCSDLLYMYRRWLPWRWVAEQLQPHNDIVLALYVVSSLYGRRIGLFKK